MKIIIFGATGTIGKHLVDQSLKEGHEVLAFCRNSTAFKINNPRFNIFTGDVLNPKDVQHAIRAQDIVCIALGSGKSRKSTVRSAGTKNIIEAMQIQGVRRLICQSTLGTGESRSNLNFFWKHIMFGWFLKEVFLDHELQEKYVKESDLDWTIVRPGAFTDGERTGNYRQGFNSDTKTLKLKISRADVADFILKEIKTGQYLHQTPGLSY